MNESGPPLGQPPEPEGNLLALGALAIIVGVAAGFVGAAFRGALDAADRLRDAAIALAHGDAMVGFAAVVVACAAATFVAAWLVSRFSRYASGSGIPHVETVLSGELPPAPYGSAAVKFVGGVLAIGSGLALGREGPSVQMGASIAVFIGRAFGLSWTDCRALCAAGAGAGLATAFNAPFAGAAFVLEELVQRFETRTAIAGLAASAAAIGVSRFLLGDAPDFHVAAVDYVRIEAHPLFFALGAVAGLIAIVYNRTLLATIAAVERVPLPVAARAGLIGAGVGALAWLAPGLVGGGDALTQSALAAGQSAGVVAIIFLIRLGLGAVSYAAGAPGGLFAPMLVLGAQSGLLFGFACKWAIPSLDTPPELFAIVGMAAFFTGVVRAPLTGMVLVSEMTGSVTPLHPMLGACALALLVPTMLGNPPIYESLRESLLRGERRLAGGPAPETRD